MASDWNELSFAQAFQVNPPVNLVKGRTYPFVDMKSVEEWYPFASPSTQRTYKGGGSRFQHGDTLLARITPCLENGKTARYAGSPGEGAHGSGEFIVIRGRESVSTTEYGYYVVRSPEFRAFAISQMTGSSGRQRVPADSLAHFSLMLPPIDEQRRIAAVLGALDNKIEVNRKMNRALEEVAMAIFKAWFIDFDGVPQSEMVESELGPIPTEWKLKPVDEVIQFNPRTKLAKGTLASFVDMKALPTSGCSVDRVIKKVNKGGGAKFMQGDTLLARITPCLENGKTALVDFLAAKEVGFGSTEFIVMRPKGPISREWIYCLARSGEFRQHAISNMTGSSGRQRVPVNCFSHFVVPEPPASKATEFKEATSVLFNRIKANADESRTLAAVRDTLMPKLISGEIRVPIADTTVEAVA